MAMCSFADSFSMFDITPVENLFIEEYMLRAPGDFVKVYLYGLRLCYHPVEGATVTTIASALGLEEKTVLDAFTYWERQHVLRRVSDNPPAYSYNNLKALMISGQQREDDLSEMDRSFNTALQDLFGTRLLKSQDYARVYRWMEEMGFKPEVVLMLVRHCIENSGRSTAVTFATIEKEALRWAKNGATTLTAAEDYMRTLSANYEGAQRVLRHLGIQKRSPSVDEERMYAKWSTEWGFSLDAILFACSSTTNISNPNFNYLNKVLENRYKQQIGTRMEMEQAEKRRAEAMAPVRDVLDVLGLKGMAPTEDLAAAYAGWLSMGFEHKTIIKAARLAANKGNNSFEGVGEILRELAKRGQTNAEALDRRQETERQVKAVFAAAGVKRGVANADLKLMEQWKDMGLGMDLLLAAAEISKNADDPMHYMNRILQSWQERGIRTAEAAQAERRRFAESRRVQTEHPAAATAQPAANRPSKEVGAHRYEQRTYTDEELDALLFTELDVLNS